MNHETLPAQGPVDVTVSRPCTCHPDDNPPMPCAQRYALTECREQRLLDVEAAGHRLALELECLLLDTKDLPTVSRWWESGMQALEEWQRMFPYNGPRLGD